MSSAAACLSAMQIRPDSAEAVYETNESSCLCMPAKQQEMNGQKVYSRHGGMQLPLPRVFCTFLPYSTGKHQKPRQPATGVNRSSCPYFKVDGL